MSFEIIYMAKYFDEFVLVVPKKKLAVYKKMTVI